MTRQQVLDRLYLKRDQYWEGYNDVVRYMLTLCIRSLERELRV